MPTLQAQIEKIARDITSGPDLSDAIEIAAIGGALGAGVGYLKDRSGETAKSFAAWGAGLGVAGQYMLFHMLKPSIRKSGYGYRVGEDPPSCPEGWSVSWNGARYECTKLPSSFNPPPATLTPITSGDYEYAGQVLPGDLDPSRPVCIQPIFPCPKGQEWSDYDCRCRPIIPPPPAITSGSYYTGAVAGIGGFRGGQMPFGPGPWPTNGAQNPMDVGWG